MSCPERQRGSPLGLAHLQQLDAEREGDTDQVTDLRPVILAALQFLDGRTFSPVASPSENVRDVEIETQSREPRVE